MGWFKRDKEGITTSTKEKKETPEGLWHKCSNCKTVFTESDFVKNFYVCDGSAIPANLGVNPSLTITAMTEYAMSKIPKKI